MAGSIHIKLEYNEALMLRRDVLLLEKDLLESMKSIKNYESLRMEEFTIKAKMKKDIEALEKAMDSLESDLPRQELEEVEAEERRERIGEEKAGERELKKEMKNITGKRAQPKEVHKRKSEIERQIDEIKAKLAQLG